VTKRKPKGSKKENVLEKTKRQKRRGEELKRTERITDYTVFRLDTGEGIGGGAELGI
jgi:hypothetical protein